MDTHIGPDSGAAEADSVRVERLLPAGDPVGIAEIVELLGLHDRRAAPPERPRVLLNMISTVDGRASLGGRSGPIGDRADRALFHGLRGAVDGVLVGAGTVRDERYGRMIPDAERRRLRLEQGLSEDPLACIVSDRLALDGDLPLLREPAARVAILTASAERLPATAASVEYVRAARDGHLDLAAAIRELCARFEIHSLLCEGGPHLALQLLDADLLDELLLSLSPLLAGGDSDGESSTGGEALRILAGDELRPPAGLALLGALRSDSRLFLRYGVLARARVSRETMSSSSLAS